MLKSLVFSLCAAAGLATVTADGKSNHDNLVQYCDKAKDWHAQRDTLVDLFTEDAVFCLNGECTPFFESMEGFMSQIFVIEWEYDIIVESSDRAIVKFTDYVETHDGCSTMFSLYTYVTHSADGKIFKGENILSDENLGKMMKCLGPSADTASEL